MTALAFLGSEQFYVARKDPRTGDVTRFGAPHETRETAAEGARANKAGSFGHYVWGVEHRTHLGQMHFEAT